MSVRWIKHLGYQDKFQRIGFAVNPQEQREYSFSGMFEASVPLGSTYVEDRIIV